MKRISTGYYKTAAILALWGAADVVAYFLMAYIGALIQHSFSGALNLVAALPYFAVAKLVIAGLLLAIAAIRVKLNRKIRSATAVSWLVAVAVLLTWGLGMYCTTSVLAGYVGTMFAKSNESFAEHRSYMELQYSEDVDLDYLHWKAVHQGSWTATYTNQADVFEEEPFFVKRLENDAVYAETAIFDSEGNMITCSWEDFFYFSYGQDGEKHSVQAYFNREKLTEAGKEMLLTDDVTKRFDIMYYRFIGCLEGKEFVLQRVEYISQDDYWDLFHANDRLNLQEVYELPGTALYEDPDVIIPAEEITVVHADRFYTGVCYNSQTPGFVLEDGQYDSLSAYITQFGPGIQDKRRVTVGYEDGSIVMTDVYYCYTIDGEYQFRNYLPEGVQLQFYVVSAVYCQPWLTAMGQLREVYIVTFVLAALIAYFVIRTIRRNMVTTMKEAVQVLSSTNEHRTHIYVISDEWHESKQLIDLLEKNRELVREQKHEITRLNTALEYAKTAEENRRQMTSNIAHELKTPLAIIHSYAEGLKERIAEEKRDKYIDVILSETERTDAMVLQMLDLSRLEAGKVKLAQDTFSLIDMTKSIFDRLELAANAKELKIEFDFPKALDIVADEGRMAQVIENLATNAVKYTPDGGKIRVEGYSGRNGTVFSIENDSEPLSKETLDKVWDVFYRADEARSGGGTGLGLAITKTIVELHGGKCSVQNTKTGVKFGFTL